MIDPVTNKLDEIAALCRRFRVRRLDLFGSATGRGLRTYEPGRSDLDFVVWFDEPTGMGPFDQFFGLLEALEALFGRKVDLVDGVAIRNPYFRESVSESRETIYAARTEETAVGHPRCRGPDPRLHARQDARGLRGRCPVSFGCSMAVRDHRRGDDEAPS